MTERSSTDIVERLRSTAQLPVCPYDRRSPDYWTTPDDKPCVICGQENTSEGPDKCRGADTRVMEEAAQEIERLRGVAQAGWMPIETAPMIGLVWVFGGRHDKPSIVEADGDFWRFHKIEGSTGVPTHWQPLIVPASPMPSTPAQAAPKSLMADERWCAANGIGYDDPTMQRARSAPDRDILIDVLWDQLCPGVRQSEIDREYYGRAIDAILARISPVSSTEGARHD